MTGTDQKGKEGSVFISARAPVWKKRAESSFFMIPVHGWETFFCPSDKVRGKKRPLQNVSAAEKSEMKRKKDGKNLIDVFKKTE